MLNYRNYGRLWRVYLKPSLRLATPRKVWNAVQTEWAYRRRIVDVRSQPYVLNIEPLYYCNMSCPLCQRQTFAGARKNDAGRLPLDLIDRVFDEIGDTLLQCHIFGLGEPLLDWPRTRHIIEAAAKKRVFTLVSSNATLITPQMAAEIVASPLNYIVCAIDGMTQENYAQYRVGGDLDKAVKGLRLLCAERDRQRSKIAIEWQFLVNRFNEHEQEQARVLAQELGVFLRFSPLLGMESDPRGADYWLPKDGPRNFERPQPRKTQRPWHCYWLWRGFVINSNGFLARCPGYQNVAQLGDLRTQTVMGLYNGRESQRARQLFVRGDVPDGPFPAPCNTCSFYCREHGGENMDKREAAQLLPRSEVKRQPPVRYPVGVGKREA